MEIYYLFRTKKKEKTMPVAQEHLENKLRENLEPVYMVY